MICQHFSIRCKNVQVFVLQCQNLSQFKGFKVEILVSGSMFVKILRVKVIICQHFMIRCKNVQVLVLQCQNLSQFKGLEVTIGQKFKILRS